jgi:hypothetical protein
MTDEAQASVVVYAEYELPHHIWVTNSVLDRTFETFIGPVAAKIYTPHRTDAPEATTAPMLPGVPPEAWDPATQWTTTYAGFGTDDKTALRRIALELREGTRSVPRLHPAHATNSRLKIQHVIENHMDEWFERVVDWVTVVTGEDINPRQPAYDANPHARGLRTWSDGRWQYGGIRITTPTPCAVTDVALIAILHRVALSDRPPVEHQLRRDAIQAFVRTDFRKAALDAATAVEVCLIRAVYETEQNSGQQVNRKQRQNRDRGIVSRSNWLADNRPGYQAHHDLRELANLRNSVIHSGADADQETARRAVETAIAIVEQLGRSPDPRIPVQRTVQTRSDD